MVAGIRRQSTRHERNHTLTRHGQGSRERGRPARSTTVGLQPTCGRMTVLLSAEGRPREDRHVTPRRRHSPLRTSTGFRRAATRAGYRPEATLATRTRPRAPARNAIGPVELHAPAERLLVDHQQVHLRPRDAEHEPERARGQAQQSRLHQDEAPDLAHRRALHAKLRKLHPAVEHEVQQRLRHAEDGHQDRDRLQGPCDREGAVEYLDGSLPQGAARGHHHLQAGEGAHQRLAARLQVRARLEVDAEARHPPVGQVPEQRFPVADHETPVSRVVVEHAGHAKRHSLRAQRQPYRVAGADAVTVAEQLAHDHAVAGGEPRPDRLRRGTVEKLDARVPVVERHVGETQGGRGPGVADRVGAVAADVQHPGHRREPRRHVLVHGGGRAAPTAPGRAHVEIRLQPVLDPHHHRLAEAADHHRHADDQRGGDRHRGDDHRGAAEGRGKAPGREAGDGPEPGREPPVAEREHRGRHPGRDHRRGADETDQRRVASDRNPLGGRHQGAHRREHRQRNGRDGEPGARGVDPVVEGRGGHRLGGGDARGLARRPPRGEHRDPDPGHHRDADGPRTERDLPRRAAHVERADGLPHRVQRADREQPPEHEPGRDPERPEHRPLEQERRAHHRPRRPDRAHDADLLAPPHDVGAHRVVDEERAHEDGGVAHHPQVPAERAEHPAAVLRARAGRQDRRAGRQERREHGGPVTHVALTVPVALAALPAPVVAPEIGRVDVDPVEPSDAAERPLRRRDVHHDEAPGRDRGVEDALHVERQPAVAGDELQGLAGREAERCAHPHRRFADRSREIGPAQGAGVAEPHVSDQIHPEQRHLLAGRRHEREALDAGRERERRLDPRQLAVGRLRNAADLGDLVARRSLQRFERRSERAHGGFARKVHRHDHGDPQRHRRHRQQRPQRVRDQRTHDEAVQHDAPRHGGFH